MSAEPVTSSMLRASVHATLSAHQPSSLSEHADRERALAELGAPDVLWRHGAAGHLTASSFVVDRAGRILLTHHPRYRQWQQLGGHLEPSDVSIAAAAAREAREESGLHDLLLFPAPVQVVNIPGACPKPGSFHFDVRYLLLAPSAGHARSDESLALGWFDVADIPSDEQALLTGAARAVSLAADEFARRL